MIRTLSRSMIGGGAGDFTGFLTTLLALPRPQSIRELLYQPANSSAADWPVLKDLFYYDAPLEVLKAVCNVMTEDPMKTNIFSVTDHDGEYPLHFSARYTTGSVEVLQFVIDQFPHALVRRGTTKDGCTPLDGARTSRIDRENHAAILRCLEDNAARYPALLNQLTVKCCLVRMKNEGMTEFVLTTPHNEQTSGQFVFEVLDMTKNCAMQPLADDILSYVGTNVRLDPAIYARDAKKEREQMPRLIAERARLEAEIEADVATNNALVSKEAALLRTYNARLAAKRAALRARNVARVAEIAALEAELDEGKRDHTEVKLEEEEEKEDDEEEQEEEEGGEPSKKKAKTGPKAGKAA